MLKPIRDFVAFDLETTGLERDADEIIEIGAVKVKDGAITERMSRLVKADKPLPALVEALTGITAAMLAEAGGLRDALEEFSGFAGDLPLVAHNADFDATFVQEALRKHGLPELANPVFDSLLLARAAWPTFESHRLETLVGKLGIPPQPAHRALPDAEQAAHLWNKAQERLAGYAPVTVASMRRVLEAGPAHWRDLFLPSDLPAPVPAPPAAPAPADAAPDVSPVESLFASAHGLAAAFSSLGRAYEPRQGQARLAALVDRALHDSRFLAAETEPGVGRLLGLLVPAARHALATRRGGMGRPVVVSAGSRRVQDRILEETSVLRALFGPALRVAALKAPSCYLSPRKFAEVMAHPETWLRPDERLAMLPLLTWLESTQTGDITENMGFNSERQRLLWSKLCSDGYLSEPGAFAAAARERAARAHLALVPHELVVEDLSLDFALLPSYEAILFEEAHRLPETAQARLGREIGFFRLKHLLQLIAFSKTEPQGLVAELDRLAAEGALSPEAAEALARLKEKSFEPEKQLQKFFGRLAKQAQKRRKDGESKIRFADRLAAEFGAGPEPVSASLSEVEELLAILSRNLGDTGIARTLRKTGDALRAFRVDLEHLGRAGSEGEIFWMEEFPNPHRALIRCGPLDPGAILAERFHPQMSAVVFASPGLAVGDQWSFFRRAAGLDGLRDRLKTTIVRTAAPGRARGEAQPESPAGVPGDHAPEAAPGGVPEAAAAEAAPAAAPLGGPAPATVTSTLPIPRFLLARSAPLMSGPAAAQAVSDLLARTLLRLDGDGSLRGGAFVFFTHVGLLKQVRAALEGKLAGSGLSVLAQHVDGNRENLLHLFRHRRKAVLLGTETFVEGLSGGDAVPDLFIVTKLPFPVPGEPLLAAALEKVQEAGGNPLHDLLLPSAVLRFKQELGRFPRRAGPRGGPIVWVLDPRLVTEKYGRSFVRGLGVQPWVCGNEDELLAKTEAALREG